MKKTLLLTSVFLVTMLCALMLFVLPASAATYSGDCGASGSNLKWSMNTSTGVLEISGSGAMENYQMYEEPWREYIDSIKTVIIGDNVTSIGTYAFYDYRSITSVTLGKGVTSIGKSAFWGSKLTSITIPASVTSIGNEAFALCFYVENIEFAAGSKLTTIGDEAFEYCFSMESIQGITIPASVTSIGRKAFSICTYLKSVKFALGSKLTSIGEDAFDGAYSLETVYYHPSEAEWNTKVSVGEGNEDLLDHMVFGHFYDGWKSYNTDKHTRACECGVTEYADHTWDDGEITTRPTTTSMGVKTYTCDDCGRTKTEKLEALHAHTWGDGAVTTEPTHTKAGVKTYTCSCGDTQTEWIAKTPEHTYSIIGQHNATQHKKECECDDVVYENHHWDEGAVILRPTATEEGTKVLTCEDCGATKHQAIPATGEQEQPTDDPAERPDAEKPNDATDENEQPADDGLLTMLGCQSVIGSSAMIAISILGAALLTKKKKED